MKVLFRWALLSLLVLGVSAGIQAAPLRFGVLPAVDAVPYLVAWKEGLYAQAGLDVQFVFFKSPLERDTAFQSGAVDGTIGDVFSATLAQSKGFPVSIVASTDGRYLLLAGPQSTVRTPKELANIPIGGSLNSIIQFMTDRMLTKAGVPEGDVKVMSVPSMPIRMEMIASGQLQAACLPDPLATAAVQQGARVLATSDDLGEDPGVLFFAKGFVRDHRNQVELFLKIAGDASKKINARPDAYRDFLVDQIGLPASIRSSFEFVTYRPPRLAENSAFLSAWTWMKEKKLLSALPRFEDLIDRTPVEHLVDN